MDANLIVTYDPTHASKAKEETESLAEEHGKAEFLEGGFEGVFLLHVKDPKKTVKALIETCKQEPYKFRHTFRWIPVDKWIKTDMAEMEKAMDDINKKMGSNDSWKMDLGKRGYDGDTMDLISKLTEHIDKPKVDLKNPQKIIKVEIIGDRTAVSLLDTDEYLNVARVKVA